MKPHSCVTSTLPGEASCLSFLMRCFRSERKRNGEWEWRGNINRNKGMAIGLFLNSFCSRSLLERIACGPCLLGSAPWALFCLPEGCCGMLLCTFPLPGAADSWPSYLLFFQRYWGGKNKLSNLNTSALGFPMVLFREASVEILALSLHKCRRPC